MRFFKFALILSALTLFIFACTQNNSNTVNQNTTATANNTVSNSAVTNQTIPATDEFASSRKIFAEKCVICHKENGAGGEVDFEGARFKVPNYKSDKAMKASDEKLLDYIENGDDEMPSFKGKLTPEEMKSLVKFIRKEFQGK